MFNWINSKDWELKLKKKIKTLINIGLQKRHRFIYMKWCVLTKIIYFISKWRCFYVIIDKKKGLMISRLVIIDLPPPKGLEKAWLCCHLPSLKHLSSLSYTGQETYPFTSCLLFFYLDKTRGCYKELRPTPQPGMFATK